MKRSILRYTAAVCLLLFCVILAGCGCGKKEIDPASEQVLKISITPEPTPTPSPETADESAVITKDGITMFNLYLADHPTVSGVTGSSDDTNDTQEDMDSEE